MKRFLYVLIILISFITVNAQLEINTLGFEGNFTTIFYSSKKTLLTKPSYSPMFGLGGSIEGEYKINNNYYIKLPLMINFNSVRTKGLFYHIDGYDDTEPSTLFKTYLEFGVLPGYFFNDKMKLSMGPLFSYNLSSHVRLNKSVYDRYISYWVYEDLSRTVKVQENNPFKLGYAIELELLLNKRYSLFIQFKQRLDLFSVEDPIDDYESQLNLGFKFDLKKDDISVD